MKKLLNYVLVLGLLLQPVLTMADYLNRTTPTTYTGPEVIETLYGNLSSYNTQRSTQCTTWDLSIVPVSPGTGFDSLGDLTTPNKIYLLEDGDYPLTNPKMIMGTCIAVVGKGGANIYTTTQESDLLIIFGPSQNVIIDNVTIDGTYATPTTHASDSNGINIQTVMWAATNNTINNSIIQNVQYALNIAWSNDASNNIFTNNTIQNNEYGVYVNEVTPGSTSGLVISGNELIGNGTGIDDGGTDPIIDNNSFSGNTAVGNTGTNATGWDLIATTVVEPDTCTDPAGCDCYGTTIANGVQCTDGNTNTISYNKTCTDPDGCSCYGSEIAEGVLCTRPTSGGGSSTPGSSSSSSSTTTLGGEIDDDVNGGLSWTSIDRARQLRAEYTAIASGDNTTGTNLSGLDLEVVNSRHGMFFNIIISYAEQQEMTELRFNAIVNLLIDIFSQMDADIMAKYHFDKDSFIAELMRIIS